LSQTNRKKSQSPRQAQADTREQHERFVEVARDLGCDEDEEAFDKALKKIASEKPPASVQKRKRTPSKPKHRED
jgi:hypothetical protein